MVAERSKAFDPTWRGLMVSYSALAKNAGKISSDRFHQKVAFRKGNGTRKFHANLGL